MSDIHKAMADTKNLAKQFNSVLRVAAALDAVGDLEQVTQERKEAAEAAEQEAQKTEYKLNDVVKELDAAVSGLETANGKAVRIVAEAEQKAQELEDNAEIRAGGMVATAQAQVTGLKQKLAAAEQEHNDLMQKVAAENREMLDRRDAIRSELDAVEAKFRFPE